MRAYYPHKDIKPDGGITEIPRISIRQSQGLLAALYRNMNERFPTKMVASFFLQHFDLYPSRSRLVKLCSPEYLTTAAKICLRTTLIAVRRGNGKHFAYAQHDAILLRMPISTSGMPSVVRIRKFRCSWRKRPINLTACIRRRPHLGGPLD